MDHASSASRPRAFDLVLYLVGVAGIAASITLLFLGMRAVMDVGGFCAEGGAYVIRQHCPNGAPLATLLGFLGGFTAIGVTAWKGYAVGGSAGSVVYLAWPAAFGALGFNFLQYGLDPPGANPGWDWGWLICGIVFEAMAIGPLVVGLWAVRSGLFRSPASAPRVVANRLGRADRAVEEPDEPGVDGNPREPGAEALVGRLERLAVLHEEGALTDDEFARAKAGLLEDADR